MYIPSALSGFIMGKDVVKNNEGEVYWVEYLENGGYRAIAEILWSKEDISIVSGSDAYHYQQQIKDYESRYPNAVRFDLSSSSTPEIYTVNNELVTGFRWPLDTRIVYVPAKEQILLPDASLIETLSIPYKIEDPAVEFLAGKYVPSTILYDKNGNFLYKATTEAVSIGPLTSYVMPVRDYGLPLAEMLQDRNILSNSEDNNYGNALMGESRPLLNPISNVTVRGTTRNFVESASDGYYDGGPLVPYQHHVKLSYFYNYPRPTTIAARLPYDGFSAVAPKNRFYYAYGLASSCTTSNFQMVTNFAGGRIIKFGGTDPETNKPYEFYVPRITFSSAEASPQPSPREIDFDDDGNNDRVRVINNGGQFKVVVTSSATSLSVELNSRSESNCGAYSSDIWVTMQVINGSGKLFNPDGTQVEGGEFTRYGNLTPQNTATNIANKDFDGDNIKDSIIPLELTPDSSYQSAASIDVATHLGVYLTGAQKTNDQGAVVPNFIRAVDKVPEFINKGLPVSLNAVDFYQTDLYVFRVGNGQLVTSHRGIDTASSPWSYIPVGADITNDEVVDAGLEQSDEYAESIAERGAFNFAFLMRGPDDYWDAFNPFNDYKGWASQTRMADPFKKWDADHLRIGERLQLIVINRATGYIGSKMFTSTSAGNGGDITNALGDIEMYPPNLKIWAERVHEIQQGRQVANQDTNETNLIGNEGITLEDDLGVAIHTEWLDQNGRPLPSGLNDFGYTARLAKVNSTPTPDVDVLRQNNSNAFL